MDKRYAIIQDGTVVNVVMWDGEASWTPPPGLAAIECPEEVGAGWTHAGDEWTPPEVIEE